MRESPRLAAVPVTNDPPKRAPKPTPNHIALVVRLPVLRQTDGQVERGLRFEMKAEVLDEKRGFQDLLLMDSDIALFEIEPHIKSL